MKYYLSILLLLLLLFNLYANDTILIKGKLLNNSKYSKIVVQKFGIGVFDVAAVTINNESGEFIINIPADVEPGIYRLRYSQTSSNGYLDVIINGIEKDISFSIDVSLSQDIMLPFFINSEENKSWYQFKKIQNELFSKILLVQNLLVDYPNKEDKLFKFTNKQFLEFKNEYINNRKKFINQTTFFWAKQLASFESIYFPNINNHIRLEQFNAHDHFWDNKPTNIVQLLNTPLYTDAILNYLNFYINPIVDFSKDEQDEGFIKCVDKILLLFGNSTITKEFAIKYLQLGFKELGNENILQYIDEKYARNELCTSDDNSLKLRLESYQILKIGNSAPEIELIDSSYKSKTLLDFPHEEIIVVFWASWCPHCIEEMPKLQDWAKNNLNTLVLAISLDDNYELYQETIKNFPNMFHYCDLKKWDSKIVLDYYINATPTFFIIDKDRKIKSKFSNINLLFQFINNK